MPQEPKGDEFSIESLINPTDVASGMHTVPGEAHWMYPMVLIEEEPEEDDLLEKEATGLTSIPASLYGGELLQQPGIPQPPGQSREFGDDEEVEYFLASAPLDHPPKTKRLQEVYEYSEEDEEDDFFDFLSGEAMGHPKEYLKHVANLHKELLKLGISEEAIKLHYILKKADVYATEAAKDTIERYIFARNNVIEAAKRGRIQVDYDPSWGLMDEVSFEFAGEHNAGGMWWYNHGAFSFAKRVTDIVSGEEDPSLWGLQPHQLEIINELARKYRSDLLGGLVFLERHAMEEGATLDGVDAPAALYLDAYNSMRRVGSIDITDPKDLSQIKELRFSFEAPEQLDVLVNQYVIAKNIAPAVEQERAPAAKPAPTEESWEGYEELREPWIAYAQANNLGIQLNDLLEWFSVKGPALGLTNRSQVLAYLTGASLEESPRRRIGVPEPPSEVPPESLPVEENAQDLLVSSIERIIKDKGIGVGRGADMRMEQYVVRESGSPYKYEPLARAIIENTDPDLLQEVLTNKEDLDRLVLRLARRAVRKRRVK